MQNPAGRAFTVVLILGAAWGLALAQESESTTTERPPFVIGLEDTLNIFVYQEPELSVTATVRPDGKITVPLVGDITAEGLTPAELGDQIATVLQRYVKDPVVTVSVQQINHFKVFILGEVATQGRVDLGGPTRFLQAIAQAGGLSQFADRSNITVLRYENGEEVRIRVDYRKILSGRDPEANILLQPGDVILVN